MMVRRQALAQRIRLEADELQRTISAVSRHRQWVRGEILTFADFLGHLEESD